MEFINRQIVTSINVQILAIFINTNLCGVTINMYTTNTVRYNKSPIAATKLAIAI